ncbi:MAG TPA: enolase C-terminal domain-like protein [Gemmatimonadota bacterium]|nr:enolase C-terminal domain-like protein [Gemmatimonadota bacterium]
MSERQAGALLTALLDPSGAERQAVVLRVVDESGAVGWGEASPLPGYSEDDLTDVEAGLDDWAARWTRDEIPQTGDPGDDPALAALPAARCAVDTALLDLAARRNGVPLHAELLAVAPPVRPVARVPVAALVSLTGVERPGAPRGPRSVLGEVTERVAEGYKTVKLKIGGEDFAAELAQLAEIRAAFPFLQLRLDANGSWTPEQARANLAELKQQITPELVEQPVDSEALFSFAGAGVLLAADESMRVPGAIERLGEAGGCAAVVLKPMVLGGSRPCLQLARAAFAAGMGAIVSHTFGGPVAHSTACELALALAAIDPTGRPFASGLAGHDELAQRRGPWVEPVAVAGHGVDGPW